VASSRTAAIGLCLNLESFQMSCPWSGCFHTFRRESYLMGALRVVSPPMVFGSWYHR
jgi:hypothetical protein